MTLTRRGRIAAAIAGAVIYAWACVLSGWQLGELVDARHQHTQVETKEGQR